jgi:glycosyltransferase involved in cell wall biosynthesis
MSGTVSIILFCTEENWQNNVYQKTIDSVLRIKQSADEVLIINSSGQKTSEQSVITHNEQTLGEQLNLAFKNVLLNNILLVDNRLHCIALKKGAPELFNLAASRSKNPGMIYADYGLQNGGRLKEVHLLKHHIGRVRDNQDYGKVFYFPRKVLQSVGYANESLKFNTLYDLRLRISQQHELIHIANKYAGSLYHAEAEGTTQNVFDYLLAGKESQLEAEQVLSSHLKDIGAYLHPQQHYMPRPDTAAELKASVIIPVNKRPEFIQTAIESVQNQTIKDIEVIVVVNGGNDDPTAEAVKEYMEGGSKYNPEKPSVNLLVFEINNLGLCLNMGAKIARGKYYIQLDSDDRLKPDAVEKILAVYEDDPQTGMVIGSYEVWEKKQDESITRMESLPVVTHDEWTEKNGRNNLLRINGAGAPRSVPINLIRQIGFSVNEEPYCRNYGEDYGMVLKLSEKHKIGRVWEAIYEVIRHSGGTDHSIDQETTDRNDEAKDYMRAEAIKRRIKLNKA